MAEILGFEANPITDVTVNDRKKPAPKAIVGTMPRLPILTSGVT